MRPLRMRLPPDAISASIHIRFQVSGPCAPGKTHPGRPTVGSAITSGLPATRMLRGRVGEICYRAWVGGWPWGMSVSRRGGGSYRLSPRLLTDIHHGQPPTHALLQISPTRPRSILVAGRPAEITDPTAWPPG